MFHWLLFPLTNQVSFLNVFQYITFRSTGSAITALLISFIAGPSIISWLQKIKFGQSIRTDGPESHLSKKGTPTMGGALMIFSVTLSTLLWQNLTSFYSWLFLGALLAFGLLGFLDDYLKIKKRNSDGISSTVKSVGQLIISTILVLLLVYHAGLFHTPFSFSMTDALEQTKLYIPILKNAVVNLSYLYIPFAIVLLIGTSNATNLTDGLDGLLAGLLLFSFGVMAVIAYVTGHFKFAEYLHLVFNPQAAELVVPIAAVCGACVGFLWYNCYPAQVFMGDTGSLAFGGVLGLSALMVKKEILLILIGAIFVIETVSVIIQVSYFKYTKKKYGTGKRIFLMTPIHHHFEKKGWPEPKVVVRFWILGVLFALIALSSLKFQ